MCIRDRACSHQFKKLGRAMIRPIYDQCTRRDGAVNFELARALDWWIKVLKLKVAELRPWVDVVPE
eukprot:10604474-Karenia_brevis.AAC.1